MALKEVLRQKIEEFRPRTQHLLKQFGHVVIDEVTIEQTMGGARDIASSPTSPISIRRRASDSGARPSPRRSRPFPG